LCIRRLALGQLLLSLTMLVLVGAALCRVGHPTRHCPRLFTLSLILGDGFELLEPRLVD
jgi:hypothetical protein